MLVQCGAALGLSAAVNTVSVTDIQVSSHSEQGRLHALTLEERFRLSVRTSMLSEFRDAGGALGAFEVNQRFTTLGAICTALERLPGIRFDGTPKSFWSVGPKRFSFKSRVYEITAPFGDIRVAPAEPGAVYPETEELFRLVVENLVSKWQNRERSRFFRV
jgi:hypothetical protein